jgi:hypothetical protein
VGVQCRVGKNLEAREFVRSDDGHFVFTQEKKKTHVFKFGISCLCDKREKEYSVETSCTFSSPPDYMYQAIEKKVRKTIPKLLRMYTPAY